MIIKSNLFLLGSYVEGFPNVIIESLSVGVPCLIFKDSKGGQKEIVIENFNGYICDSINDFSKKIKNSINKKWDNQQIILDVNKRFNKENIIKKYKNVFEDALIH